MATLSQFLGTLLVLLQCHHVWAAWGNFQPSQYPYVPNYGPQPNLPYMVDNQHNYFRAAPDKVVGTQNGPVWAYSGSFDSYMANLRAGHVIRGGYGEGPKPDGNGTMGLSTNGTFLTRTKATDKVGKRASSYWLATLGPLGSQPLAGSNYTFYRNVVDQYHADSTGNSDASESINAAIQDGNRCGLKCGNTFTQGAIIYFPPGTYKICSPIIQLYYTQFIGDATNPPTIKGCDKFVGIALFDTDPYIPGGGGDEWFVNQNQFFRHIRNFIFDMNDMPLSTSDNNQPLVPTGIHWQVAQATSLQNLVFNMPHATSANSSSHVGIFMENGSGGFVSDLTFNGGAIGWRAGSQQYTARNLKFYGCLTSVQMVWDWGFNWQGIEIYGGAIGFNISGRGGDAGQGIGSVSIIDSFINDVPTAILTNKLNGSPNIVIDNLHIRNVVEIVGVDGGSPLLTGTVGSSRIDLWATGLRYNGSEGSLRTGNVVAPSKAPGLLKGETLYVRSRPQYETTVTNDFLVATHENIKNDGTGDQAEAINAFLVKAKNAGQIAYFPAGIYQVGRTVFIPTGSRVQGSSWSQIQGAGFYFADANSPQVMVRVGNKGDVGDMEIVEMLFTVRGPTAGAILMEWNVDAASQGSAAMWDSHFRVGGGTGTDLDWKTCPKRGFKDECIAASLMFHITRQASGYFENVWAWVADHDNDKVMYDEFDKTTNQISVYGARGMLIESQGPSWFYGGGSEHSVLYNYQLNHAANIYMGHIQTESPYFQPNPVAPAPFGGAKSLTADPTFDNCTTDLCRESWGLRILDSTNVTIHSAGLYSFFQDYYQDCVDTHNCQEQILQVKGSTGVVLFNLFTVATSIIASGIDQTFILQKDTQSGFTTEVSVWLPLPGADNIDVVYVGTEIWSSPTMTCPPPCILVLPSSSLPSSSTITPGNYTTSFEYGNTGTTTIGNVIVTTFFTTITTLTIEIPLITIGGMPYSNVNVTSPRSGGFVASPSVNIPPIGVILPDGNGSATNRVVTLPPWPDISNGPPDGPGWRGTTDPFDSITRTGTGTYFTPFVTTITATRATVTTLIFPSVIDTTTIYCTPSAQVAFATPHTTISLDYQSWTSLSFGFTCPSTKVFTFLGPSAGAFTVDCSVVTAFPVITTTISTTTTSTATTPLPVWTTWPPGIIMPVEDDVKEDEPRNDGVITPCHLWFFFICILHDDLRIGGWYWIFPPGIYPPGPPPPIQWPSPWIIQGTLPPWPKITIGPDHKMTYSDEPSSSCKIETASACKTINSLTETVIGGTTTTVTSTTSNCEPVTGCSVTDQGTTTATTTTEACKPTASGDSLNVCMNDAIVYPTNISDVADIVGILAPYAGKYEQVGGAGYTGYFWVPALDQETYDKLKASAGVDEVDYYEQWNAAIGAEYQDQPDDPWARHKTESAAAHEITEIPRSRSASSAQDLLRLLNREMLTPDGAFSEEKPQVDSAEIDWRQTSPASPLRKRAATGFATPFWPSSVNSLPKEMAWRSEDSLSFDPNAPMGPLGYPNYHKYWYDDTGGIDSATGTAYTVYVIGEQWVWENHREWTQPGAQGQIVNFDPAFQYNAPPGGLIGRHGSGVAAQINGYELGRCKRCRVMWFRTWSWQGYPNFIIRAQVLEHLYAALADIKANNMQGQGKAVVNMSWVMYLEVTGPALIRALKRVLDLLDAENVVLVAAAGNSAKIVKRGTNGAQFDGQIDAYPAKFGSRNIGWNPFNQLTNLIVVGSTDALGYQAATSQHDTYLTTYAPGREVFVTSDPAAGGMPYELGSGTSFATPAVSGIIAFLRSLDSPWKDQLRQSANVKKMVTFLAHRYKVTKIDSPAEEPLVAASQRPVAWNGQVQRLINNNQADSHNCLLDWATVHQWDSNGACDGLDIDMRNIGPGESTESCVGGAANPVPKLKRDDTGSCPTGSDGGNSGEISITFTPGSTPSPTCAVAGGCGGALCTGYYCTQSPSGIPPDFLDPKDPDNDKPRSTTTITDNIGTATTSSATPTQTCNDQCKLDRGNPCTCNEIGCDANSPSCCAGSICPACSCTITNDCTPVCCASGTCAWSWTGGGGGWPNTMLRSAGLINSTAPSALYDIWSITGKDEGTGTNFYKVAGYDGSVTTACNATPEWHNSSTTATSLQVSYANLTVYGDTCMYLASVSSYEDVAPGAQVGSLTCRKWTPATCYRANATDVQVCSTVERVTEELVCEWS